MPNFTILVSIIMNCHNGEKYLHESISSVINQTYENWELIFGIIAPRTILKVLLSLLMIIE